jgi:hypothetical protein
MRKANLVVLAVIIMSVAACKKSGNKSGGGNTPSYLPAGFEKVRMAMTEPQLTAAYPAAKKTASPSPLNKYDARGNSSPMYEILLPNDKRFVRALFGLRHGRLHYFELTVKGNNCTPAYMRGMAKAMAKKTGESFTFKESGAPSAKIATGFFGKVRASMIMGPTCHFYLEHADWLDWTKDWNKKVKVKM